LLRKGGAVAWREFFVILDVAFLHSAANAAKKRCCASRHVAELLASRVTGDLAYHDATRFRVYQASLLVGDIHMGILTDDMKRVVREQRLGYIATVCPDGTPNLSPKGTTRVWDDDHLVFADIRSPQSVRNIEHNPSVEVNVVDPLVRKGYRFKGWGVVHRSDEVFQRGCQMYREMGLTLEIRAVVLIRIERALPVTSPAYDRGDTEELVKDRWRKYWRKLWREVEE
jgi:predicted pyridoxine 5'-phosphate oxidase superfamily flavin-nucleotide-binding protein